MFSRKASGDITDISLSRELFALGAGFIVLLGQEFGFFEGSGHLGLGSGVSVKLYGQ
jgi:hypothetical protein